MPPLRTIITLAVVLALGVLAILAIEVLPQSSILTRPLRITLTIVVVGVLLAAIASLVFILPVYWD